VGFTWGYRNVIGRIALQYGTMINIVQHLDGTVARGRGISAVNLRYMREATLGHHWGRLAGVNLEAGIFLSYVGMESYLLAENWLYTRSVACDATLFYFQGLRAQIHPTTKAKVELWLMNGCPLLRRARWHDLPRQLSPHAGHGVCAQHAEGSSPRHPRCEREAVAPRRDGRGLCTFLMRATTSFARS